MSESGTGGDTMIRPLGFGGEPLGEYATDWTRGRGRLHPEPSCPIRTDFQRDRDRILHSTAFRRLNHKTQVFVFHEGDHYRTRLTHSLEVAQIARSLARALLIDEALAEALALAHDLGHPPFGHDGERALQAAMEHFGGFDHNAQSLRVVTRLETRYAEFDGLNLTWETLEGLVKHNGPLIDAHGRPIGRHADAELPYAIRAFQRQLDLELASQAGLEAQAAAIADDIAYNAHDVDDGLRSGLLSLEALGEVGPLRAHLDEIHDRYPNLDDGRVVHEISRRMITCAVEDAIGESMRCLKTCKPMSVEEVRSAGRPLLCHSEAFSRTDQAIKDYLFTSLYRNPSLLRVRQHACAILTDLFQAYWNTPSELPELWRANTGQLDEDAFARRICDYVAGMTDWFAMSEHRRLFDVTPDLR